MTLSMSSGLLFVALGNAFVGAERMAAQGASPLPNIHVKAAYLGGALYVLLNVGMAAIVSCSWLYQPKRVHRALVFVIAFVVLIVCTSGLAYTLLMNQAFASLRPVFDILDPMVWFGKQQPRNWK